MRLPFILIRFGIWWLIQAPKAIFTISKRVLRLVNNQFAFTTNLRLFFTPLFGDYTVIGRFIGFVLRTIFVFAGLFFIAFLAVLIPILPLLWWPLPIILIYYVDFIPTVLIYVVMFFVYSLKIKDIPISKVKYVQEQNPFSAFRYQTLHFYKQMRNGKISHDFISSSDIQYLFKKAELETKGFAEKLLALQKFDSSNLAKEAYNVAKQQQSRFVENEQLFLALVKCLPNYENELASIGSNYKIIEGTVNWIVQLREDLAKAFIWQEDYVMPPMGGFGHGMTGRVTPNLDAISTDYTKMAKSGRLEQTIGRKAELDKITEHLGGANVNILLIGEPGSGKTSLIKGLANSIIHGTNTASIKNKRIVDLEMGGIISGAKTAGDIAEKLKKALDDARGSGDIILFIDEIHSLAAGIGNEQTEFSSIYAILEPHLSSSEIQFIGATSIQNYRKFIEPNQSFARLFEIIEIPEASEEDTLAIIEFRAKRLEEKYNITITVPALYDIIRLSKKMVHERVFPDKAIDILNRGADTAANSTKVFDTKIVAQEISELTHVPTETITEDESKKLLAIGDEMKQKVIGQDRAVSHVAAALKRARIGIRDENKPIASFLFVGTTGVGKTETAKTLSEVYFGDKKAMIRLDMSEYQTPDSIDKLIGTSDGKSLGILTEAVRTKPFTLILLDEIEKAHQQILLAFLQVLDDGRLTDSTGRTIDFTNTIIIATSNTGTRAIQEINEKQGTFEDMENAAMNAVREHFAPEFLNRFTAIIVFNPLSMEDARKISLLMLEKVKKIAKEKNITLTFSLQLINEIVKRGYNPEWGARPMARVIEDTVETYLAEKMLAGEIKQGDIKELGLEAFGTGIEA